MEAPAPPEGGDVNRGELILAIFWIQTAVAIIIVGARFWGRILIRAVGWDDYLMLFTLLCMVVFTCFTTYLTTLGGFRHMYYLSPTQTTEIIRINWISQPFVIFPYWSGKASIAVLLLRLSSPELKVLRCSLYFIIVSTFVITCLDVIFTYVQCNPVQALWMPELLGPGVCWDPKIQSRLSIFTGSWNVFIDFFLAVLPVTMIWNLKLSLKKKLGIGILLGLGIFAGVMGAVKTTYLTGLSARSDLTWVSYDIFTWSLSELFVTIFCGSVPAMKPLYDSFFGRAGGTIGSSYYGSSGADAKYFRKGSREASGSGKRSGSHGYEGRGPGPALGRDGMHVHSPPDMTQEKEIRKQTRVEIRAELDGA